MMWQMRILPFKCHECDVLFGVKLKSLEETQQDSFKKRFMSVSLGVFLAKAVALMDSDTRHSKSTVCGSN